MSLRETILSNYTHEELLRAVDRSNPEVAELAARLAMYVDMFTQIKAQLVETLEDFDHDSC